MTDALLAKLSRPAQAAVDGAPGVESAVMLTDAERTLLTAALRGMEELVADVAHPVNATSWYISSETASALAAYRAARDTRLAKEEHRRRTIDGMARAKAAGKSRGRPLKEFG